MNFYLKTYGCQQNVADSQRIAAFLEGVGWREAMNLHGADFLILNSCSVRQAAEDKVYGWAKKVAAWRRAKPGRKVILTGCLVGSAIGERRRFPLSFVKKKVPWVDYFWGTEEFEKNAQKSFRTLRRDVACYVPTQAVPDPYLVPIISGCDHFCSYCVVPYARGKERSRPFGEVVCEVERAVKRGVKEVLLLGQNVNSYNPLDVTKPPTTSPPSTSCIHVSIHRYKEPFPRLLATLSKIPNLRKISFLTSHPKDMSEELIDAIADLPKVSKDVHLPVQSGDDEILKKMNRGYRASDYLKLVVKLRKKVKGLRLSTDIIVGFPGETGEQFENTVKLFKKAKFDHAFIAMYSPRPGTAAARFENDVPLDEKRRRHGVLLALVKRK